ncbi:MAG TPA: aspartate carbamoyltransferase [Hungateiclostridium thermocellum]|jgi:aspartate carbamoyltransferase catalytic subunit|uniref:Aspartate carbamoyltransferase catalytic subunit n=2 Tax=Acetivibrio thermocellus TaxID=1515 RepID=PYRB_ACET2|nr:aspartate carbamoyltransferase catalytic subunit [Acetivibrio thermocellus]A3DE08.1 RecName: Full=Aspartate carbamoyltransferase catalytic subunit; AltName: Full=Aspartate transcarbamylase; Short=ATCase [Acetivibrio thermocellus ATCC 27405]CDG35646.1 Aspartate carbamoyltransferase [Acetivibrio thermocellus BC1]ABN52187.1 aspartate carbamoyltransferase [Acetivibrio thermocellus ATCC 27405]ADU74327.1 aspartate carbamoyltransferase [Acetivibrio thermocellus DSM 1313]ALX08271.1 Aspartate carbam
MILKSKDLLGLKDLTAEEIQYILNTAKTMKVILLSKNKKAPHLQGKSIITLFYENSTRTRLSFELASKYLSANAANISVAASSVAKGETLIDTGKTIDMMGADVIVIRHSMSGAPHLLARNVKASVINAGDGMNEHPTQALLDMFTIIEKKGSLKGLKVAIIGDIYHSRVARSNIWGMTKLGAEVSVAGPSTLMPPELDKTGVKVFTTVQEALIDADVVMGLRIQKERQKSGLFPSLREYSRFFGLDEKRLKLAKEDALILHPGPVNRGVELPSSVIDSERSFINEQVTNGVAVRMALLYLLTRRDSGESVN